MKHLAKLLVVVVMLISLVAVVGCGSSSTDRPTDQTPQQPADSNGENGPADELAVLSVNAKEFYYRANGSMLFYFELVADRPLKEGEEYVSLAITLLKDDEVVKEFRVSYYDLNFGGNDRILLGLATPDWLSAEEREEFSDIDELLVDAVVFDGRSSDFSGPRYQNYIVSGYEVYPNVGTVRICSMTGEEIQYTHTIDAKMSSAPEFAVIGRIEFSDGSSILVHLPYDGPSGQLYKEDFDPERIREFVIVPSDYVH